LIELQSRLPREYAASPSVPVHSYFMDKKLSRIPTHLVVVVVVI